MNDDPFWRRWLDSQCAPSSGTREEGVELLVGEVAKLAALWQPFLASESRLLLKIRRHLKSCLEAKSGRPAVTDAPAGFLGYGRCDDCHCLADGSSIFFVARDTQAFVPELVARKIALLVLDDCDCESLQSAGVRCVPVAGGLDAPDTPAQEQSAEQTARRQALAAVNAFARIVEEQLSRGETAAATSFGELLPHAHFALAVDAVNALILTCLWVNAQCNDALWAEAAESSSHNPQFLLGDQAARKNSEVRATFHAREAQAWKLSPLAAMVGRRGWVAEYLQLSLMLDYDDETGGGDNVHVAFAALRDAETKTDFCHILRSQDGLQRDDYGDCIIRSLGGGKSELLRLACGSLPGRLFRRMEKVLAALSGAFVLRFATLIRLGAKLALPPGLARLILKERNAMLHEWGADASFSPPPLPRRGLARPAPPAASPAVDEAYANLLKEASEAEEQQYFTTPTQLSLSVPLWRVPKD